MRSKENGPEGPFFNVIPAQAGVAANEISVGDDFFPSHKQKTGLAARF